MEESKRAGDSYQDMDMNDPGLPKFDQYPDLNELRKYWSLCIVVPEGQNFKSGGSAP